MAQSVSAHNNTVFGLITEIERTNRNAGNVIFEVENLIKHEHSSALWKSTSFNLHRCESNKCILTRNWRELLQLAYSGVVSRLISLHPAYIGAVSLISPYIATKIGAICLSRPISPYLALSCPDIASNLRYLVARYGELPHPRGDLALYNICYLKIHIKSLLVSMILQSYVYRYCCTEIYNSVF